MLLLLFASGLQFLLEFLLGFHFLLLDFGGSLGGGSELLLEALDTAGSRHASVLPGVDRVTIAADFRLLVFDGACDQKNRFARSAGDFRICVEFRMDGLLHRRVAEGAEGTEGAERIDRRSEGVTSFFHFFS